MVVVGFAPTAPFILNNIANTALPIVKIPTDNADVVRNANLGPFALSNNPYQYNNINDAGVTNPIAVPYDRERETRERGKQYKICLEFSFNFDNL